MERSRIPPGVLSVLGLIAVLALVIGLDTLVTWLLRGMQTFDRPYRSVWAHALTGLLVAALLLLLFWFALTRLPRSPWVGVVFLLVGLYIGFAQVLYFAPALSSWWPPFFNGVVILSSPYTVLSGSFIAVMGLLLLVLPPRS